MNQHLLLLLAAACHVGAIAAADEVHLQLMSSGAMEKLGGYMPQRITLSTNKPDGLKSAPSDLASPLYGVLKLGPAQAPTTFFLVVDEPENKPARLFVDTTGKGDLSEDSAAEWTPSKNQSPQGKTLTMYSGGATLKLTIEGQTLALHLPMYRFDKTDPQRAQLASNLFYYSDYARTGEISLGAKTYAAMLTDDLATGDFLAAKDRKNLLLDLNKDGKFDRRREAFDVKEPFNIGGTTYEIQGLTSSGASLQLVKSTKSVPESKPPADLSAGQKAIAFEATTTDGNAVNFPVSYKGKLVMLDFWATWCGPCRAELPNLTKAYDRFHGQGFEVLAVSLDQTNAASKLAEFTKDNHMPWPQVYDGKFWQARVAQLYDIDSIPRAFLVDGSTGVILATGQSLRGDELAVTLEKAITKKQGKGQP